MPGYEYKAESNISTEGITVETGFDAAQFGDLELYGIVMEFKESGRSFWESIGVGGSVPGEVVCRDGLAYFGACDRNFYAVDIETGNK